MSQDNKLNELIKINEKKLSGYTYVQNPKDLENGSYVRYIKKEDNKLAHGGKLMELIPDKKDTNVVYKIKIKNNYGGEWMVKLNNIYLFYKTKKVTEMREEEREAWKKSLTTYELKKWKLLHTTPEGKKTFQEWFKKRHPESIKK